MTMKRMNHANQIKTLLAVIGALLGTMHTQVMHRLDALETQTQSLATNQVKIMSSLGMDPWGIPHTTKAPDTPEIRVKSYPDTLAQEFN